MPLIDLSRTITHNMQTDPRLPQARIYDVWTREQSAARYAPGVSFQMAAIDMVQATGTYIDSPWHRHEGAPDLADLPLDRLADLPGVCIDARPLVSRGERRLSPDLFASLDLRARAVLICTGVDKLWDSPRYRDGSHPFLTEDAANLLVARGAALYAIDTLNADDFTDMRRPAHTILLGAPPDPASGRATRGIPIVENLTGLDALFASDETVATNFRFTAAPVKIKGLGSFPVRAWASVDE